MLWNPSASDLLFLVLCALLTFFFLFVAGHIALFLNYRNARSLTAKISSKCFRIALVSLSKLLLLSLWERFSLYLMILLSLFLECIMSDCADFIINTSE